MANQNKKKRWWEDYVFMGRLFFLPSRRFYGPQILIDLNVGVFLAMAFSGLGVLSFSAPDLAAWGANYGPLDHGLGLSRLVTSQFVHTGARHLLSNLYGLFFMSIFAGMVIPPDWRLILCYLLCGLGGSVASLVMHPQIVSAGASGSIMGLCGILLASVVLRDTRVAGAEKLILLNVGVTAGLTLLLGLTPHIDNAAHVGGLLTGMLIGTLIRFFIPAKYLKPHTKKAESGS